MASEEVEECESSQMPSKTSSCSSRWTQYLAAMIATIGGFIDGTCLGWTSPTENSLLNGDFGFKVDETEIGWVGSVLPLGAIVAAGVTATLVDRMGRRNLILALVLLIVIGWAVMAFATSVYILCIGRFLTGIVTGSYCVAVPIYTTEVAEKDIRGTLGTYFQLQITLGILFVYAVGNYVSAFTLTIICGLVPLLYAFLMLFMPETPYFYIMRNNLDAARKSLTWLRDRDQDNDAELDMMQRTFEADEIDKVPFFQAFRSTAAKRGLVIGLGLMVIQQFCGINTVIFYSKSIFKETQAPISANMSTIVVGVVQVVATWIATIVIDKLGRRFLSILSIVVMTLCLFALGLYFFLERCGVNVSKIGSLPLLSITLFIIIYSLGFGPIPWMMMGEIFPSKVRGAACSLVSLTSWLGAFVVAIIFPLMQKGIGPGYTFWCFTVCAGLGIFFVLVAVPETKGKTLMEIQEMLGGGEPSEEVAPANRKILKWGLDPKCSDIPS